MQDKYGDQGLTVLAITAEGKKLTEDWVADKGAKYAYAYDKSSKLMRELGASGYPSAALVDASGKVVWTGHPGSIKDSQIESALTGALPIPMWEWPKAASSVRKSLQKGEYAKALAAAQKMKDGQQYVEIVENVVKGQLAALETAFEAGDFLTAYESSSALRKSLKGLPGAARADEIAGAIKSDKGAQAVIKAQKDVAKLAAAAEELRKRKDAEAMVEKLRKIQQKHVGTYAAEQASDLAERLRKAMGKLR